MLDPGGSQSLLSAGVLGCCVVLGCWGVWLFGWGVCCCALSAWCCVGLWCGLGLGAVLVEVCGVLHVFGGVVVGGWWCSVEPVPGQSGRAMNLGRGL